MAPSLLVLLYLECINMFSTKLLEDSFLSLEPLYCEDTINSFNNKFDELFSNQNSARRYVDSLDIYNLGIIDEIFTPKLVSLIFSIIPNPVLYHCHAYEIDGLNSKPHIAQNNFLNGWHRDVDCIHDLDNRGIQHVSLFVYLTHVGNEDGAFEICSKKLGYFPRLFKNSNFYKITGVKGHSFLFNRTAVHRASPNQKTTQRRVLKISFQSKDNVMPALNKKIKSHEKRLNMLKTQKLLPRTNILLRSLFGDKNISELEIKEALGKYSDGTAINFLDTKSTYEIKCKMGLLEEFRGFAKDLVYIKNLILYKLFSSTEWSRKKLTRYYGVNS